MQQQMLRRLLQRLQIAQSRSLRGTADAAGGDSAADAQDWAEHGQGIGQHQAADSQGDAFPTGDLTPHRGPGAQQRRPSLLGSPTRSDMPEWH